MCFGNLNTSGQPKHITIHTFIYHMPPDYLCSDSITAFITYTRRSKGLVLRNYLHTLACCLLAYSLVILAVVLVQVEILLRIQHVSFHRAKQWTVMQHFCQLVKWASYSVGVLSKGVGLRMDDRDMYLLIF